MTYHTSEGKVKTSTVTANLESYFDLTVKSEARSSNHDETQDPKPHEVEYNNDITNKRSQEIKNRRGNTSEEQIMLPLCRKLVTWYTLCAISP